MSKSRRNPFSSRAFSVERLEDRQLMAADVAAYMTSGTLNVVESAGFVGGDNAVEIRQVAPGVMRVTGLYTSDDPGTSLVNGHAYQDFSGVLSLNVNLGGGNDIVNVGRQGTTMTLNNVFVNTDGTNKLNFHGYDYDHVNVVGLKATGQMTIQTGIGNDQINLGVLNIGSNDLGNLTINTGPGSDVVNLNNVSVKGNLAIQTADGNSSATDSDSVWLQTVTANEGIYVKTGRGNDSLTATDVTSSTGILFDTGDGNDTVNLNSVRAIDDFFTQLGSGNDVLHETYLRANRLTLDGGAGNDSLTTGIDGTVNLLSETNWELINNKPPMVFKPLSTATSPK
jgi:hypothetical protein